MCFGCSFGTLYRGLQIICDENSEVQEFAKGGRSFPFHSSPFFSPFPFPSSPLPLEVRPFKPARGSGERRKLPQCMGIRDRAPAENEFGAL